MNNTAKQTEYMRGWRARNLEKLTIYNREYQRRRRLANPHKVNEYVRAWSAKYPDRYREIGKKWSSSPHGKKSRTEYMKKYRDRDAETRKKTDARTILHIAIVSGRVVRQPCEVCGEPKSQAHHPDYSKPLDVRWLCLKHHGLEHKRLKLLEADKQ